MVDGVTGGVIGGEMCGGCLNAVGGAISLFSRANNWAPEIATPSGRILCTSRWICGAGGVNLLVDGCKREEGKVEMVLSMLGKTSGQFAKKSLAHSVDPRPWSPK